MVKTQTKETVRKEQNIPEREEVKKKQKKKKKKRKEEDVESEEDIPKSEEVKKKMILFHFKVAVIAKLVNHTKWSWTV